MDQTGGAYALTERRLRRLLLGRSFSMGESDAMTRLLIALFVALGFGFVVSGPTSAQTDVDCGEIATDADAQAILAAFPGDPFDLDRNNDGHACDAPTGVGGGPVTAENFLGAAPAPAPAAPATDTGSTTTQTALPDTGTGSMAATSNMGLVTLLAALGIVSLAVATRRTVRR